MRPVVARFSEPFTGSAVQDKLKAHVEFAPGQAVEVRVGISAVDIDGARGNLEAEAAGKSFDTVMNDAFGAWNKQLSKIEIDGGTQEQRRTFYTAIPKKASQIFST